MLQEFLRDASSLAEPALEACTAPQEPFRRFRQQLEQLGISPLPALETPLATKYEWKVGNYPISLLCGNTAWVSVIKERAGMLVFPPHALGERQVNASALTLTALHHPTHWMSPDNRRRLREKLEEISDVVITAHEHESSERDIEARHNGASYLEIEAPVLQDRDDDENSRFQVLLVDLAKRQRRRFEFGLTPEDDYALDAPDDAERPAAWEDLLPNQLRIRRAFSFSKEHQAFLNEMELSLQHSGATTIALADLFVWPDLREVSINPNVTGKLVRGERVREALLAENIALVTGDAKSGKTALAKMLCSDVLRAGHVPVLIRPDRATGKSERLAEYLEKEVVRQYGTESLRAYRELPRESRLLILDDFHEFAETQKQRRELVRRLADHAGHVVLLADDAEIDLTEVITGTDVNIPRFRIQEFGFVQRGELIERWVNLSTDPAQHQSRVVIDIEKRIHEVLGKNFVPSYPLFILALLQASEGTLPADTRIGTYGAYYELLIRGQLMRGSDQKEFNTIIGYLTFVTFKMYSSGTGLSVTRGDFRKYHQAYETWSDLSLNEETLLKALIDRQVLQVRQDGVSFRYQYVAYYFLASYIRDHITDEEVRDLITRLASETHRRESADILLFVAHLTRDTFVVDALINAAQAQYPDVTPLRELAGLPLVKDLGEAAIDVAYKEKDCRDALRQMRERNDNAAKKQPPRVNADVELIQPIARLTAALRLMQVLGQVLRNFPGQLNAEVKLNIVRTCFLLGARSWGYVFSALEKHGQEVAAELTDAVLRQEPQLSKTALGERIKRMTTGLVHLAAHGFVKRIAQSIGAPELGKTYEKLLQHEGCETARLVRVAISLDHEPRTPELELSQAYTQARSSPLSEWLIKELVVEHLMLRSDLDTRGRQRVCQAVDVKYQGLLAANSRRRRSRPK